VTEQLTPCLNWFTKKHCNCFAGIVPGIKPHLKAYTLPGTNGDTVMQGLDSLASRCKEYYLERGLQNGDLLLSLT
jgi:fructose-bisphosphate aldolase class 1